VLCLYWLHTHEAVSVSLLSQQKKHLTSLGWLEIGLLIDTNGTRNSKNPSLHQEVARCRFIHMYVFFVMQSSRSVRKVISDADDAFGLR